MVKATSPSHKTHCLQAVIELDELGVRFGKRQILDGLSIGLFSRNIGLLGPNGAGKSTLIHALLGFCPLSSGTAKIFGHDIQREMNQFAPWWATCRKMIP